MKSDTCTICLEKRMKEGEAGNSKISKEKNVTEERNKQIELNVGTWKRNIIC